MITPNWQHHSKKEKKRKLKPQALRSARERRRQLIKRHKHLDKVLFYCYTRCINKAMKLCQTPHQFKLMTEV